jgi:predicted RNA-binding protein with RPS1 domain
MKPEDNGRLKIGMTVPGIITNITVSVLLSTWDKENGLVHISEMTDKYIDDPSKVVKLNQHVRVKIIDLDMVRKRIQLSLRRQISLCQTPRRTSSPDCRILLHEAFGIVRSCSIRVSLLGSSSIQWITWLAPKSSLSLSTMKRGIRYVQ